MDEWQKRFRENFSGTKEKPKKTYEEMTKEEKEKFLRERNKNQTFSGFADGGNVLEEPVDTNAYLEQFKQALSAQQPSVDPSDVRDAQLAQINEEIKTPYQKTKPELLKDQIQQAAQLTPEGQASQDRGPVAETPQVDPMLAKYKEAIAKYESKLAEKPEENKVMNWLTGIGQGANVISKMKGTSPGEVQYYGDVQKKNHAASEKENLSGLQNLQNMYAKYLEMQKRNESKGASELDKARAATEKAKAGYYKARSKAPSQKVTEGEKVIDREFAKDYNDWASGGKADYEVNSKIFKDAIKGLKSGKVSTGSMSGMGSRIPGYRSDTRETEDQVRKAINGMLRATLGAQFTEKEGERIFAQTFDPFKSEEANVAAMEAELAKLEKRKNSMEDMGKYYTKKKTLSGYEVPTANSEIREVKRKTKDGKTAIFNADTKEFLRYE